MWSFSVRREPTFLRKFGSWTAGIAYSTQALAASTLAAASSFSAASADASAAMPTPVAGGVSAKNALIVARAGTAVEQRLLGALVEALAVGPGRIGQHERAYLGGSAVAAPIQVPVDQLASRGVRDLVAQRLALGQVGLGYGLDRIANAARVFRAHRAIACCGDGGVVARGVLHLLRRRSRRGACLGGWCRSGLRSWSAAVVAAAFCLGSAGLTSALWAGLGAPTLAGAFFLRGLSEHGCRAKGCAGESQGEEQLERSLHHVPSVGHAVLAVKSGAIREGRQRPRKGGITMTGAQLLSADLAGPPLQRHNAFRKPS